MSSWSGSYCVYVSLKYSQLFIQQTQSNSFLSQAWLTDWWLIHHHLDAYFPLNNNAIDDKLSKQHRQIVLLHHSDVVSRSRLGLHCLPSGYSHDASSPTVVHLFLCHAHSLGFGHTSKISVPPPPVFSVNHIYIWNCTDSFSLRCTVCCHGGGDDNHHRYVPHGNAQGRPTGTFAPHLLPRVLLFSTRHAHWGQHVV